ncbi:class I SAM-dependent methyltransferase [Prosthecomicrobium sp. N25]|uniref:class I SAM-dependent methyltransferase n=1 Tax=Prosthecomicrobium sp. N25 TaxID=3129254 RepID=UPI003076DE22
MTTDEARATPTARLTPLDRLRRVVPAAVGKWLNRAIYEAAYLVPEVARSGFFNGGYRPLSPNLLPVPGLGATPSQVNLVHFVLVEHPADHRAGPPARLLDIGCGAGGGLRYAAALWPGVPMTGVDASASAIRAARRLLAPVPSVTLLRARGEAMPLPEAGFDFVASIGTLTNVGMQPFMAEAARVLAPGGILSLSVGTRRGPANYTRLLREEGAKAGLTLLRVTDLTPGSLAAMEADADALASLIARLPRVLHGQAREWAALPGSARHARYLAGERHDYAAVFRRTGG